MKGRQIIAISSRGVSSGFALVGLPVFEAANGIEALRRIYEALEDESVGVVIIDEALYRELPEDGRHSVERSASPIIIPVPGPSWTAESTAHEYIVEILRRAIGYRVRLQ